VGRGFVGIGEVEGGTLNAESDGIHFYVFAVLRYDDIYNDVHYELMEVKEMVVNMLKAIKKMLEIPDTADAKEAAARVDCAVMMLGEIIQGMEGATPPFVLDKQGFTPHVNEAPTPKKETKSIPGGQYKVVVDANRRISRIEGLPLDGKVEIDGKVMTHKEAIGKTFTSGRVLG